MLPGSRKATTWKKDRIAVRRAFREQTWLPRCSSRLSQEVDNRRCIQIVHTQREWLFAGFLLQELQHQPERIAVGHDRPRTDLLV
jgi:hypothetical protein